MIQQASCVVCFHLTSLAFSRRMAFIQSFMLWSIVVILLVCATANAEIPPGKNLLAAAKGKPNGYFKSMDQVRRYLVQKMVAYYMQYGRPRFGKRSVADERRILREESDPDVTNDYYQN